MGQNRRKDRTQGSFRGHPGQWTATPPHEWSQVVMATESQAVHLPTLLPTPLTTAPFRGYLILSV